MLQLEMMFLILVSFARLHSQVRVDLFLWVISPRAPISRVVWEHWNPFPLMSSTKESYLSYFLCLAPSVPESQGTVSSTRLTLLEDRSTITK